MMKFWTNTPPWQRGLAVVLLVLGSLVIVGALAYNASQGLPIDGAKPPAIIPSRVALAVLCPDSGVTVHDVGDHGDRRAEVGRNRLSPIRGTQCRGRAPDGVVRIHSCESGGGICVVDGELQAGVTALRVEGGEVIAADMYVHGRLDPIICARPPGVEESHEACDRGLRAEFAALLDHELLHVDGVGVTADGEIEHATGCTHIMSDCRGTSWRWLEVE